jgi:selenide,water dikinase
VTDVTGFGLTGHLAEMMRYSGVTARVRTAGLPVHAEARGWIAGKIVPGGTLRNLDFARPRMRVLPGVSPDDEVLVADAQTSGGLLIAVAADEVDRLLAALASAKTPAAAVIGEVVPRAEGVDLVLEP